ncbi:MAG: Gfo/Idh/MocA family oxidoreductase [Ignavibacteria bacterium]|nr:Gfo/Idh/MocA family oxidoreductase [Ignavibacteria bacterium]
MATVRIGMVGLGWVAQVIHLPILSKMADATVVAVCDKAKDRARLVSEKYGIGRFHAEIDDLLAGDDIDAVILCTPTDQHKEGVLKSLAAGKHVLVEKPIAPTYRDAVEIEEAARASKRHLMVGMNQRFRPDAMILKSFIEGKELGEIFYARIGWLRKRNTDARWLTQKDKSGGGVLLDLGIAIVDLGFWMMGFPKAVRIKASHFHHSTKEVEDTSLLSITTETGSVISVDVSWSMCMKEDVYSCHIFGTEGTATLSPLSIVKSLHGSLVNVAPTKTDPPERLFRRSYENEIRHFLAAVRGVHPVISTVAEARQRMMIMEAAYKSARLGKEILLQP